MPRCTDNIATENTRFKSGSHMAVVRQSSGSRQAVVRQSSGADAALAEIVSVVSEHPIGIKGIFSLVFTVLLNVLFRPRGLFSR